MILSHNAPLKTRIASGSVQLEALGIREVVLQRVPLHTISRSDQAPLQFINIGICKIHYVLG